MGQARFPLPRPQTFDPPPGGSADRPAIRASADRPAQAELFGSPSGMAFGAEAADVAVVIAAALGERDDMVGHRGCPNNAPGGAVPAERLGT